MRKCTRRWQRLSHGLGHLENALIITLSYYLSLFDRGYSKISSVEVLTIAIQDYESIYLTIKFRAIAGQACIKL